MPKYLCNFDIIYLKRQFLAWKTRTIKLGEQFSREFREKKNLLKTPRLIFAHYQVNPPENLLIYEFHIVISCADFFFFPEKTARIH